MNTYIVTAKNISQVEFCVNAEDKEGAELIAREMIEDCSGTIPMVTYSDGEYQDFEAEVSNVYENKLSASVNMKHYAEEIKDRD
jgi:hypothetical protein